MTSKILALPNQAQLKELLWYEPKSGIFRWRTTRTVRNKPWDIAGAIDGGYVRITIGHTRYFAHRLAWLYMTGQEPSCQVDHIDGNKKNNAWCNLRAATNKQNSENRTIGSNNTSGILGVSHRKNQWEARIRHNGKAFWSKRFKTMQEAKAWYEKKRDELFTHHKQTKEPT